MYTIDLIVDMHHVGTPMETVLDAVKARIRRGRARGVKVSRRQERTLLRAARARHVANRKLYLYVMRGI